MGGGKSRLRRVDSQLQRTLKDATFQLLHQLKDRPLTVLDQTAILGFIDRIHDLGKNLIDYSMQLCRQLIPIDLNQPFPGLSFLSSSPLTTPLCHTPKAWARPIVRRRWVSVDNPG